MTDENRETWQPWVDRTAAALGIDPGDVDLDQVLTLTSEVAHRFERPMAPVAAYMAGIAVGRGATLGKAVEAIEQGLPE